MFIHLKCRNDPHHNRHHASRTGSGTGYNQAQDDGHHNGTDNNAAAAGTYFRHSKQRNAFIQLGNGHCRRDKHCCCHQRQSRIRKTRQSHFQRFRGAKDRVRVIHIRGKTNHKDNQCGNNNCTGGVIHRFADPDNNGKHQNGDHILSSDGQGIAQWQKGNNNSGNDRQPQAGIRDNSTLLWCAMGY